MEFKSKDLHVILQFNEETGAIVLMNPYISNRLKNDLQYSGDMKTKSGIYIRCHNSSYTLIYPHMICLRGKRGVPAYLQSHNNTRLEGYERYVSALNELKRYYDKSKSHLPKWW